MKARKIRNPNEVFCEYIKKYETNASRVAKEIGMSQAAIRNVTIGKQRISIKIALLIGKYFGTGAKFWINLQTAYEIQLYEKILHKKINVIKPISKKRKETKKK